MKRKRIPATVESFKKTVTQSIGTLEYYCNHFSIMCTWDGDDGYGFVVQNNRTKEEIDSAMAKGLLNAWDKLEQLKSKYIIDLDGKTK